LTLISDLVSGGEVTKKSLSLSQSIQSHITGTRNQTTLGLGVNFIDPGRFFILTSKRMGGRLFCELRVASCELRAASCELRVANCELRVASR
jgi:hypothetical protein